MADIKGATEKAIKIEKFKLEKLEEENKALRTDMNTIWVMFCRLVERHCKDNKVSFKMSEIYDKPEDVYWVDREEDKVYDSLTFTVSRLEPGDPRRPKL